ncbi:pyruvate phosphate dikinase [uncultured archaeon]|nr:pyruvate phosphate dikinase [uncultured archaeon]
MKSAVKYVYLFEEGSKDMRDLLGGKGAGLAEMKNLGLNVPPGFTISTAACIDFLDNRDFPEGMWEQAIEHLNKIEEETGKKFGDKKNPLLVSVRSGAAISMPGMMDTILNVGLNDETVKGLWESTDNERFAYDSYRRLIQMFGVVVLGIPYSDFDSAMTQIKKKHRKREDVDLTADEMREVIEEYKLVYRKNKQKFPQEPIEQLRLSVKAVFDSWNSERAKTYREIHKIPEDLGTAVSVVSMIFGNMGNDSATGVAFTRDPNTGNKMLFAEYLPNAQGEDVVAGIRTPKHIDDMKKSLPDAYSDLIKSAEVLEKHYKDMQDIEFTIEKGVFYLLQTRSGKRTARAAVKVAVDMVKEKLISREEALTRITPQTLDLLLHPQIKRKDDEVPAGTGLAASPGAAVGSIVFTSEKAVELTKQGKRIILVRPETTADDVRGMAVSEGFLTQKGGMTSHAAVVARAMGKPAVVGAEAITVDIREECVTIGDEVLREGDIITVDGTSGNFYLKKMEVEVPGIEQQTNELLEWADEVRKLGVRANANTPEEAKLARENGAEGIGLARTERMFLGTDRIPIMRAMIMSLTESERRFYLNQLLPMQISDFTEFFRTMEGYPVIIRLLDPPLHEFLPDKEEVMREIFDIKFKLSAAKEVRELDRLVNRLEELNKMLRTIKNLEEFNPMLGFRGCRLGLSYPEIYEMQVTAIIKAASRVIREGKKIYPEIMIPLVGHKNELSKLRERLETVAEKALDEQEIEYKFGTMIEIPRACVTADQIAETADFFSFGTNDLTQMTFGYSRDDAEGKFMAKYLEEGVLQNDPFTTVDRNGVGELMKMAVQKGRKTNRKLEIGICGEQGGDPETIEFCHEIGLDYVSASPFRIPVARLAAARAAIIPEKELQD